MLGMAFLRDRSIQAVCDQLHLVLPDHEGKATISSAALIQARNQLGVAPSNTCSRPLCAATVVSNQGAHRWRGLAVLGIDGTAIRVPDSDEN